ncbi:MAG: hypothetical protein ACK4IT_07955 [Thioalkalivibrionaceae bacterium]
MSLSAWIALASAQVDDAAVEPAAPITAGPDAALPTPADDPNDGIAPAAPPAEASTNGTASAPARSAGRNEWGRARTDTRLDTADGDPCRIPADRFRALAPISAFETPDSTGDTIQRARSHGLADERDLFGIDRRPVIGPDGDRPRVWSIEGLSEADQTDEFPTLALALPEPSNRFGTPAPRWVIWTDTATLIDLAKRRDAANAPQNPDAAPAPDALNNNADRQDMPAANGDGIADDAMIDDVLANDATGDQAGEAAQRDLRRDPETNTEPAPAPAPEPAPARDERDRSTQPAQQWATSSPLVAPFIAADVLRLDLSVNATLIASGEALPETSRMPRQSAPQRSANVDGTDSLKDCLVRLGQAAAANGRGLWALPASVEDAPTLTLSARDARQQLRAWMPVSGVVTGARSQRGGWQWQLDDQLWLRAPAALEAYDPAATADPATYAQRPATDVRLGDRIATLGRLEVERGQRILAPHPLAPIRRLDPAAP